jgi:hypothetical protein
MLQVAPGGRVMGETVIYKRGNPADVFTLILQGFVNVWSGEDAFHSEVGAWTTLCDRVLTEGEYCPDFTAVTSGTCRVLQISRADYMEARDAILKANQGQALDVGVVKSGNLRRRKDSAAGPSASAPVRLHA